MAFGLGVGVGVGVGLLGPGSSPPFQHRQFYCIYTAIINTVETFLMLMLSGYIFAVPLVWTNTVVTNDL